MKYKMITESIEMDEVLSQPYFSNFVETRLYRGIQKTFEYVTKVPFKFRDSPLDTRRIIHDVINKESMDRFKLPIRNLMFTYPDFEDAQNYGGVCIIVPIGSNYKLFANNEIHDLTADMGLGDNFFDDLIPQTIDTMSSMDVVNTVIDSSQEYLIDVFEYLIDQAEFHTNDFVNEFHKWLSKHIGESIDTYAANHEIDDETVLNWKKYISNEDVIGQLTDMFEQYMVDEIEHKADEYLSDVEEITEDDDIVYDIVPEIMVYAPDGFYVIPEEFFDMLD